MEAYWIWIITGVLLILSEFVVPGFIIFFFGLGSVITGIARLICPISLSWQIVVFVLTSVLTLLVFRFFMPKIFHGSEEHIGDLPSNEDECAGAIVEVVTAIVPVVGGKVSYMGAEWHAVSDKPHEIGEHVKIIRRENITLIVE